MILPNVCVCVLRPAYVGQLYIGICSLVRTKNVCTTQPKHFRFDDIITYNSIIFMNESVMFRYAFDGSAVDATWINGHCVCVSANFISCKCIHQQKGVSNSWCIVQTTVQRPKLPSRCTQSQRFIRTVCLEHLWHAPWMPYRIFVH